MNIKKIWKGALGVGLAGAMAACGSADEGFERAPKDSLKSAVPLQYERIILDDDANGPAFSEVADIDGDGRLDILVSQFGHAGPFGVPDGQISLYRQGESLNEWTKEDIVPKAAGIKWPNHLDLIDVDDDGDLDLLGGSGFLVCTAIPFGRPCGGLWWFEQTEEGWQKHEIVEVGAELFYHGAKLIDLDGDGIRDLLTVGEMRVRTWFGQLRERAETQWFKGTPDGDRFEKTPRLIGMGMGALPELWDLDNDGDMDIVSAEFFAGMGASYAWFEQIEAPSDDNPSGIWERHVIDDTRGGAIQFDLVPNFYGDGALVAIGSNHTNPQANRGEYPSVVTAYRVPADPREPWVGVDISSNITSVRGSPFSPQGAPGIFHVEDAENDGDMDILVSGDGDPRVFLIEQKAGEEFTTHVLDENFSQAGSTKIVDLDGDGYRELIVSGYDADEVRIYRLQEGGAYPLGEAAPR